MNPDEYYTAFDVTQAGPITDFHPMPSSGHPDESFIVQGARFEYSENEVTAGFNGTVAVGGPLREGLLVRIWHVNGEILRLDVKKGPTPSVPITPDVITLPTEWPGKAPAPLGTPGAPATGQTPQ